jgi:outer membrane lipoprotein SlyB
MRLLQFSGRAIHRLGVWGVVVCLALGSFGVQAITLPVAGQSVACADCGTVESVTQVQHDTPNSGVGAAIGAAVGGLIANKIGGEEGKTIATIIGLLGGVWAGNALEKHLKQAPTYQVVVRMQDNTQRNFELAAAMPVGAKVKVQGGTIVLDENAVEMA